MEALTSTHLIATGLVFMVATVFSMLGLGGGMLYVPLFKWLELPLKTVAIPLGLLLNGVTSASALIRYAREGLVDYRGGLPAAAGAVVMAPVGAWCMGFVPHNILLILFAAFTALAGLYSLKANTRENTKTLSPVQRFWFGLGLGGFNGFIGGLLGVGGGFLIAPMLLSLGFPTKRAVATTSFIVTFASISGFVAHAVAGHLEPNLTVLTLIAAIAGAQLGAWFMAKRAKPAWVKRLYAVLLLGVAAKLLWDILNP
jgi:uncharacterized membrane protein YfcA